MRVRVTVPEGVPPWEREAAGRVWPIGAAEYDLAPAIVAELEANARSIRTSRVVHVERLDVADLVAIRVTCPARTVIGDPLRRVSVPDGSRPLLAHDGYWSAGRHFPTGTTDLSVPPELAAELEAEVLAGRSILSITRLPAGATTAPSAETRRSLT